MVWTYVGFLVVIVIVLTYLSVLNARTIIRDLNETSEKFQARLERDANAVVDRLLEATQQDDGVSAPENRHTTHNAGS